MVVKHSFDDSLNGRHRFWGRPRYDKLTWTRRIRYHLRPVKIHWKQMVNRLGLKYCYYVKRSRANVPIFVIAEARTGSNLLIDYLRSVPEVVAKEEVLNATAPIGLRKHGTNRAVALRHLEYSLAVDSEYVVVKLAPHQMLWHSIRLEDLETVFPEARILVLYRQDMGAQYVSACIFNETGIDRKKDGSVSSDVKLVIEPGHYKEYVRRINESYSRVVGMSRKGILVSYEQLCDDPSRVFSELIFPYLGLEPRRVETKLKKQGGGSLERSVINFDEVATTLNEERSWLDGDHVQLRNWRGANRPID